MTTDAIPILHVADADRAATWYARLGFVTSFEHRFEPGFPLYMGLRREGAQLHLSEHEGDAPPATVVYLWVDDIDPIAAKFGVAVNEQPWAREIELVDPDHNRLRIGQPTPDPDVDTVLGEGTAAELAELEQADVNDVAVRPLGRDAALVTSRSWQPHGTANGASVWVRGEGRWLLAFRQGPPTESSADAGR